MTDAQPAEGKFTVETFRKRSQDLERGFTVLNSKREPIVNQFLKFCSSTKLKYLGYGMLAWLVASSLLIAYIFIERDCVDANVTFTNCALMVFSMMLGGSGPNTKQTDCCPTMSVIAAVIGFMTDSLILAIFVNRITSPKAKISVSDSIVLKMRNNVLLFQIRLMNEFGHPLDDVKVSASLYRRAISEEGEAFTNIFPVEFQCNYVCHAPINVSHFVDETSPFYGEELENFSGAMEVTISGRDTILDAVASTTRIYDKEVLRLGHQFETVFIKRPEEVINGSTFIVDASKLSNTEPLADEILAKINHVISLNIAHRLQYGTSCPSVLRATQGIPSIPQRLQFDSHATIHSHPARGTALVTRALSPMLSLCLWKAQVPLIQMELVLS